MPRLPGHQPRPPRRFRWLEVRHPRRHSGLRPRRRLPRPRMPPPERLPPPRSIPPLPEPLRLPWHQVRATRRVPRRRGYRPTPGLASHQDPADRLRRRHWEARLSRPTLAERSARHQASPAGHPEQLPSPPEGRPLPRPQQAGCRRRRAAIPRVRLARRRAVHPRLQARIHRSSPGRRPALLLGGHRCHHRGRLALGR